MNKHFLIGLSLIAVTLASCSKREIELDETDPTMIKAITESLIEASATSKSEKEVFWEPGDEIAVFSGELSGKFESTLKKKPSSSAVFKGDLGLEAWPEEMDIWAVYPYSEEAFFDGETITTVLPSEQIAKDGAFGKDMNLAVAHSNTSILQFYNVGGGLRFSITEEGIKKVIFEGLNGEIISGKVKIGFSEDGLPEIRKVVSGSQFITILPPDGQETFQKDTWYYIVVIPGSLERGYKLRFYKDSDYARKVSDNSMKIKRNFYRDLENADEEIEYEATTMHFPETKEEWEESGQRVHYIGDHAYDIVNNDDGKTEEQIKEEILAIEGVLDVIIEGGTVSILQNDSLRLTYFRDSQGLELEGLEIKEENEQISKTQSPKESSRRKSEDSKTVSRTNENNQALILSPYFGSAINRIKKHLLRAGFQEKNIHIKKDHNANVLLFKGEELVKYKYVFIDSHGALEYFIDPEDEQGTKVKKQTNFLTGTPFSKILNYNLTKDQIAVGYVDKGDYRFCMTPAFINKTDFTSADPLVFLGACHSAEIENNLDGSGSMVGTLLNNHVGAIAGYSSAIASYVNSSFADGVILFMSAGFSFQQASLWWKKSQYLSDYCESTKYYLQTPSIWTSKDRKVLEKKSEEWMVSTIKSLDYNLYKYYPISTSYYLINPYPQLLNPPQVNSNLSVVFSWECELKPFTDTRSFIDYTEPSCSEYRKSITCSVVYDLFVDDKFNKSITVSDGFSNTYSTQASIEDFSPEKNHSWYVIGKLLIDGIVEASFQSDKGSFTVTEDVIKVKSISLDKLNLELNVGNSATLKPTILPSNATNKNVTWSSSNTSVASVSSAGEVKGIAKGTATITVKTEDGGKTATCRVSVVETKVPVSGVSLNKTSLSMTIGDTQTLTATVTPSNATDKSITWSSSNTSVATVSSSGVVSAKSAGSATITVTTNDGGKKSSCSVTVKAQTIVVTGVSLNKTSLSMTVGDTQTLTATITPSNATDKSVTWSSNNTSVATVSSSGAVTAKSAGNATIIVKTNDGGKTATCSVTVTNPSPTLPVPDAVDLGLSVKWASFNIGASLPEGYGDYYAWGETEPYYSSLNPLIWKEGKEKGYDWKSYKWCMGEFGTLTKYCLNPRYGYNDFSDDRRILDPEDDVAHVQLGDKWRMPTKEELDELIHNCSWERVSVNGINGRKATGPNGNSIFLPAAGVITYTNYRLDNSEGRYWISSFAQDVYTYSAIFYNSNPVKGATDYRFTGFPVRPVYGVPESVSLNKSELVLSVGESVRLVASVISNAIDQSVTWSSSDVFIAMASSDGVVTGIAPGTSIITVSTNNLGRTATCSITVQDNPSSGPVPVAIDLGLSVKWASFNLGATKPEEYGDYYAWGETEPYNSSLNPLTWKPGKEAGYDWPSYKWCMGSNNKLTKYCTDSVYGYNDFTDGKTVLDPEDDAAHVNLGGRWRMPTGQEMDELVTKCTWEWTSRNGVIGRLVTGPNGNSIFLPAAGNFSNKNYVNTKSYGFYWTTRLASSSYLPSRAFSFNFDRSTVYRNGRIRSMGFSIRPVYDDK